MASHQEAYEKLEEIKQGNEVSFCPITQENCRKDCVFYQNPYVKKFFCGTAGDSFVVIERSCSYSK